jgi:hypothetical protein
MPGKKRPAKRTRKKSVPRPKRSRGGRTRKKSEVRPKRVPKRAPKQATRRGANPLGACFFTDASGRNVCSQMRKSQCDAITGSRFVEGGRC